MGTCGVSLAVQMGCFCLAVFFLSSRRFVKGII